MRGSHQRIPAAAYRLARDVSFGGEHDGKHIDLDFGQLARFASLDEQLKRALRDMTIDVTGFPAGNRLEIGPHYRAHR